MSLEMLKRLLGAAQIEVAGLEAASRQPLLAAMHAAAEAFVTEAEQRVSGGRPRLSLDLAEAFKGLVLEAAKRRAATDDNEAVRKAFVLLGKDGIVKNRNHMATLEREAEKVRDLERALGGETQDTGARAA